MSVRILIAEDDDALVCILREFLEPRGYELAVVGNGSLIVAEACRFQPRLIISDIRLPGLYGHLAYAELKKNSRTASIPIILTSANLELKQLVPAGRRVRFLAKPFTFEALEKEIQELLALEI